MQTNIRFDRNVVAVQIDEVVHVMLELEAPQAPASDRAPIDLVLVLDRSGSMSGEPLRAVREAAANVVRRIGADDRIAVVAFDDRVEMVLPLGHHQDREAAAAQVRAIRSGGSTNLSGGWFKALELLDGSPRPEAVRRIVVLTDGHANAGIRDIEQLGPIVRGGRDRGITTSCIGFADGHDELFLAGLADSGGGDDYWCEGPDQANAVFGAELELLANVVAQNLSVEFRPTSAVAAQAVLNNCPIAQVEGGLQADLGDAVGGERRRVVAKFHLRPVASRGDLHIADIVIRWVSTIGDAALHKVTVPVRLLAGDGQVSVDSGVTEEIVRLEMVQAQLDAHEAANRGDHDTASGLLRRAAANARPFGSLASEADLLETEAANLSRGAWSGYSSKALYAKARGESKRRKKDYGADSDGHSDPSSPS